jgi:hypothetical protein
MLAQPQLNNDDRLHHGWVALHGQHGLWSMQFNLAVMQHVIIGGSRHKWTLSPFIFFGGFVLQVDTSPLNGTLHTR